MAWIYISYVESDFKSCSTCLALDSKRPKDTQLRRSEETTHRTSTWTETSPIWPLSFTTDAGKKATAPTTSRSQIITGLVRYSMNPYQVSSGVLLKIKSPTSLVSHPLIFRPHCRSLRRRTQSWSGSAPSHLCSLPVSMVATWWCPIPTIWPNIPSSGTCSHHVQMTRWTTRLPTVRYSSLI